MDATKKSAPVAHIFGGPLSLLSLTSLPLCGVSEPARSPSAPLSPLHLVCPLFRSETRRRWGHRRRRSHHAGKTNFKTRRGREGRGTTKEIPAYRWQLPDGVREATTLFKEGVRSGIPDLVGRCSPVDRGGDILHMGRPTFPPSFQPVSFPPNCSPSLP